MGPPDATPSPARRFARLDQRLVLGRLVPVATDPFSRLLGLAHLDRERAGPGLLLERCASIHTYGMRFPIDVFFLDADGRVIRVELHVGPRRTLAVPGAAAVLEVPSLDR
jgi:uncharacterized membrane protein (UPF0127 family)